MMTRRTTDDVYHQIRRRGWAPALWAHHPPEVKRAIWWMGWRPQVKQCFSNCQRFVLGVQRLAPMGIDLEVEYREGWVHTVIPMEHAWLIYEGRVLDLTLDPNRDVEYLCSNIVSQEEILLRVVRTGEYGPVYPRALGESSPMFEGARRLQEMMVAGINQA